MRGLRAVVARGTGGCLGRAQGEELHRALSQLLRGAGGRELPVSGRWAPLVAAISYGTLAKIKDVTAVIVPGGGSTLNTSCVCFGCSWGSCI